MNRNKTISCFSVSFKKGFISPNIPLATFQQGDKDITFLLDTGSENNITNAESLKQMEHTILNDGNTTHTLSGIGGTEEVYKCKVPFNCDDENYEEEFLVSSSIDEALEMIKKEHGITINGILGSIFLREHNVVMDFKNLAAYSNK